MTSRLASTAAQSGNDPQFAPAPAFPIPNRLNLVLVIIVTALVVSLLWLGSWLESWWAVAGVGVVFSYVLLTNYALLHEATHDNLHARPRLNYLLGLVTGAWFPVAFTMIHTTHQGHHLRNRTDFEMFDMYYATDSPWIRRAQWYSILCGLFWPIIPLGCVVAAISPAILRWRLFRTARSSSYLLGDIHASNLWRLRGEVLLIAAVHVLLFWLLDLKWTHVLVMYGCFSLNWSTRQYVGHAFTKRHVVDGAWNLRHNPLMTWVLLHGEWDHNHHRRPDVSWFYLPRLSSAGEPRPGYLRQYWRQWRGPQLTSEPAPEALSEVPLSVHE